MLIVRGRHLLCDLRRARRANRLTVARLQEAEQAVIESVRRDGDIKTLSCVYSTKYDEESGRFRLVEEQVTFHGLPEEAW